MQILEPTGDPASGDWILIQPVDVHDQEMMPEEIRYIREKAGASSFAMIPVRVDWFRDLTPWSAAAAFHGQPDFGDGAVNTLQMILDSIVNRYSSKRMILGGYSLAGFFALWAGYQTDAFDGIVAASPSVWYPGWDEYMGRNRIRARSVYLSLGDREERTRNPVMRTVGDRIRQQERACSEQGVRCILEWNEGNHFKDPDQRTAAGFAWIINTEDERLPKLSNQSD